MNIFPQHPPLEKGGFSLVEVVFALAIASLGFLTLLGLLPSGLEMARNSADLAAQSRIVQHLSGELQSTPWSELDWNGYGKPRYFNDQGVEIPASQISGTDMMLSYVATVELTTQANDILLPAGGSSGRRGSSGSSGAQAEPCLRRARIHVVNTTDPGYSFSATQTGRRAARFSTVMVAQSNG